ncbi:MAG: class I SAM-dependent methyltransferase [Gammaproteobacteria bacterium]|nr:class I SAM-dependent methyltransferase [Gammaproteobacteria bacterium]
MSEVFDDYANYYDMLYQDKDYKAESEFVSKLIHSYSPNSKCIIELGCGTGIHAINLAKQGYSVHGVDLSQTMLDLAEKRRLENVDAIEGNFTHELADIQKFTPSEKYDVAISLFHVMGYQTTNEGFSSAIANARNSLKEDGILIFDFWYGPAVLTIKPSSRTKQYENRIMSVVRSARPRILENENVVEVEYVIDITDKVAPGNERQLRELHRMRYFFLPELSYMLNSLGLEIITSGEWLSDSALNLEGWSGYIVAKVRNS